MSRITKTFKSSVTSKVLAVSSSNGFSIGVELGDSFMALNLTDAPALALAILEAAGIVPAYHSDYQNGTPEALEHVAQGLKDEIAIAAAEAKEAADREVLELEALKLMNARRSSEGRLAIDWDYVNADAKKHAIAIAKAAREIHGGTK